MEQRSLVQNARKVSTTVKRGDSTLDDECKVWLDKVQGRC